MKKQFSARVKDFSKSFWNYIYGINGLLLCLYTVFILFTYFFTLDSSAYSLVKWFILCVAVALIACPVLMKFSKGLEIKADEADSAKSDNFWRLFFFLVPLTLFLIKYIIYYPTAFNIDSIMQYDQAVNNSYEDWHPVIHTLLFFKLPLVLTRGWTGSLSLFQIIVFSGATAYSMLSIKKYTNTKYALFSLAFIMLNPNTTNLGLFMIKDIAFAIGALLLCTFGMHIYFTHGEWIKKPVNMILFILVTVLTTLLRHNGVLFTVPFLIAVSVMIAPKRAIAIVLCVLAVIIGIKGPLYSALNVAAPGKRQVEITGLPMTVIGAVTAYEPESLDEETREFVYKVAPKEVWETKFNDNYGVIKSDKQTDLSVIEEYGAAKIVSMALKCIKNSPYISFNAVFKLANVTYTVCDNCNDYRFFELPWVEENRFGISQQGIPILQEVSAKMSSAIMLFFPWLFMYLGSMHYILLLSVLSKFKLNKWSDWKKILFVLPVFCYNFGTMLFLISPEDSGRFSYYTFLVLPTLLILIYKNNGEGHKSA